VKRINGDWKAGKCVVVELLQMRMWEAGRRHRLSSCFRAELSISLV